MRQRRDFQALRNKGFVAAVSMRALIAWFPILVSLAQAAPRERHQAPSHRLVNPAILLRHDDAHILCRNMAPWVSGLSEPNGGLAGTGGN